MNRPPKLRWKHAPGDGVVAPLSWTPEGEDHYVVSHRSRRHTVSWRPHAGTANGRHVHVGVWTSKRSALLGAKFHCEERHANG